jgi:hypothetical protein
MNFEDMERMNKLHERTIKLAYAMKLTLEAIFEDDWNRMKHPVDHNLKGILRNLDSSYTVDSE